MNLVESYLIKKYMNQKYTSRGWAFGNLLNFVIGQGEVITTPIQVVQFMNIIATKGETKEPKLLNSKSKNIKVNLRQHLEIYTAIFRGCSKRKRRYWFKY